MLVLSQGPVDDSQYNKNTHSEDSDHYCGLEL